MNMSQVSFADKINVSKQTLYKYENDIITNIPSDKIEAIAKLCGVSPAYLMGWDDNNTFSSEKTEKMSETEEEIKKDDSKEKCVLTVGSYVLEGMNNRGLTTEKLSILTNIEIEKLNDILESKRVSISKEEKMALDEILGINLDAFIVLGVELYNDPPVIALNKEALLKAFNSLNIYGQVKALERVQELTEIKRYTTSIED